MKLSFKILFVLAGTALILSSCQKNYESVPLGQQVSVDYVFNPKDSAGSMALQYLTTCYLETIPNGHNRLGNDYLDAASADRVSNSLSVSQVQVISTGAYTAATPNADDDWAHNYAAIRDCNIFINDIYRVPIIEKLPSGQPAIAAYRSE